MEKPSHSKLSSIKANRKPRPLRAALTEASAPSHVCSHEGVAGLTNVSADRGVPRRSAAG
jgi:hypothetical protein